VWCVPIWRYSVKPWFTWLVLCMLEKAARVACVGGGGGGIDGGLGVFA